MHRLLNLGRSLLASLLVLISYWSISAEEDGEGCAQAVSGFFVLCSRPYLKLRA